MLILNGTGIGSIAIGRALVLDRENRDIRERNIKVGEVKAAGGLTVMPEQQRDADSSEEERYGRNPKKQPARDQSSDRKLGHELDSQHDQQRDHYRE